MNPTDLDPTPELSVIIPTYNRCAVLLEALAALGAQTLLPARYEVIVADDGSSDGTGPAVEAAAPTAPMRIVYSWAPNQGANAARNRAIAQARGRILVIINDDTIAVPDFLARHLQVHTEHPADPVAALGRMTISPAVPPSLFADLHLDAWFNQFTGRQELDWKGFVTCNLSVKAAFLRDHGLFEERLRWHEDLELGERLAHHGLRVIYEPAALGYHLHHLQEKDFLGVAAREGVSLAEWYAKSPQLGPTIAEIGFHPYAPSRRKLVFGIADRLFNARLFPHFVALARFLAPRRPRLAQRLYLKLYQAEKRRWTSKRLGELGHPGL